MILYYHFVLVVGGWSSRKWEIFGYQIIIILCGFITITHIIIISSHNRTYSILVIIVSLIDHNRWLVVAKRESGKFFQKNIVGPLPNRDDANYL